MIISNKTIAKSLKQRRKVIQSKPIDLEDNFTAQNNFINDPSRYIVVQSSRRAGKTNGLALRFFKTMEKHPKSQCVYLGLTVDSARDVMWPVLQEINDKYGLGCKFAGLTMTHPNGAKLRLLGADMSNFIKRLKGRKYPGAAVDEAQDFGPHLQSLIDDVLTPSISDYEDGWIALTGTPGPVPTGYFFEITQKRRFGFSMHQWTLLENPHMPNPSGFLKDLMHRREWEDNNPTYLREYRNQWVLDVDSLWIKYSEKNNDYDKVETKEHEKLHYILGVDLGFRDADALAVLAWADDSPTTYLVEELVTPQQGLTELANQIMELDKKYKFEKMVADEGALGKKLAEELRRRFHIPVQPADKARKQETVEFLNDSMRIGKFKAKKNSRFAKDSYMVQIDWDKSSPNKIVVKKKPHSDIIDAVIYAYKESPAFTYRKPPEKPKWGSEDWAKAENDRMFEAELEGLQKANEDWDRYDR